MQHSVDKQALATESFKNAQKLISAADFFDSYFESQPESPKSTPKPDDKLAKEDASTKRRWDLIQQFLKRGDDVASFIKFIFPQTMLTKETLGKYADEIVSLARKSVWRQRYEALYRKKLADEQFAIIGFGFAKDFDEVCGELLASRKRVIALKQYLKTIVKEGNACEKIRISEIAKHLIYAERFDEADLVEFVFDLAVYECNTFDDRVPTFAPYEFEAIMSMEKTRNLVTEKIWIEASSLHGTLSIVSDAQRQLWEEVLFDKKKKPKRVYLHQKLNW